MSPGAKSAVATGPATWLAGDGFGSALFAARSHRSVSSTAPTAPTISVVPEKATLLTLGWPALESAPASVTLKPATLAPDDRFQIVTSPDGPPLAACVPSDENAKAVCPASLSVSKPDSAFV